MIPDLFPFLAPRHLVVAVPPENEKPSTDPTAGSDISITRLSPEETSDIPDGDIPDGDIPDVEPDPLGIVPEGHPDPESGLNLLVEEGIRHVVITADEPDSGPFDPPETSQNETEIRVLGPGAALILPHRGLELGGEGHEYRAGQVGLVTSDRQVLGALVEFGSARGLGLSAGVALGAAPTLKPSAILAALTVDNPPERAPAPSVVLSRLDNLGSQFHVPFRSVDGRTPVAVSAGVPDSATGQVPEGTRLSPSGGRLRDSLIRQGGAVPTTSIETMVDAAPALGGQPLPDTDGVAVVSNAGGPGVMAIDAVARSALTPVTLADSTVERLDAALPEHARSQNPLDLLADSDIEVFETAMDAVLTDDAVGAAVVISAPSALFTFEELAAILADARRRHEAPVVTALMGGTRTHDAEAILREAGIPNYFDPFRAVDALETLWVHTESRPRRQREPSLPDGVNPDSLRNVLEEAQDQSIQIDGEGITALLSALGVDEGVMSPPPGGDAATGAVEVDLLGVRHPEVGPIVGVGVSTFVRAVGDWAARGVPLSRNDAEEMVQELRAWPILRGTRGREPVDIDGLVDVIVGVSWLLDTIPSVTAISVDPLLVGESGVGASSITVRRGRE